MYHPDTFMTYRGTDLLPLLIYRLLGKIKADILQQICSYLHQLTLLK